MTPGPSAPAVSSKGLIAFLLPIMLPRCTIFVHFFQTDIIVVVLSTTYIMLFDIMERPASVKGCGSFLYGTNINLFALSHRNTYL